MEILTSNIVPTQGEKKEVISNQTCGHDILVDSQDLMAHRRRHTERRFASIARARVLCFSFFLNWKLNRELNTFIIETFSE